MKNNGQNAEKTANNGGNNGKKIPRRCQKILKELEKAAPDAVHHKDLAFACNLSTIEVGALITSYPSVFRYVEKIEGKGYIKYRLNLQKKFFVEPVKKEETLIDRLKKRLFKGNP